MDFAQEVKEAADIVTLVGQHVRLRKAGPNRYKALCPFHSERTPSFTLHTGLQIFKCFGCGKGGDVFTFLMELQGLTFYEALKTLAEQQGRTMPSRGRSGERDAAARRRQGIEQLHLTAQEFYAACLRRPEGSAALGYLADRGIDSDQIGEFGLGYAPPGNRLLGHLRNRGFRTGDVRASGLFGEARERRQLYDRFRDRVMIPIHSDSGRGIGFGGRILDPQKQPKYMNSPETPVYRKNRVLFNMHRARTAMRQLNLAVLVEGYMDVLGIWRAGVRNAVAACGTALTPRQVGVMRRHCDTVVVNFDSDRAGREAAERSVEVLLREGMNVRVLELPGGMDPDEYCRAEGGDSYRELLEEAPRYFAWLLERSRKQFDLDTAEGRSGAFERLLGSVVLMPDGVRRSTVVTELAEHIGIRQSLALGRLQAATNRRRPSSGPQPLPEDGMSPAERVLVILLVSDALARAELLEEAHRVTSLGLASHPIVDAVVKAERSGGGFQYGAVEGRLESQDRERLARLVLDEARLEPDLAEGHRALQALRHEIKMSQFRDLAQKIADADRAGRQDEVDRLLEQKRAVERKLGLVPG